MQAEKRQQAVDETEQRAAAEAAAVTAAVAESVVGSPRAPSGSATPLLPHTPTASAGGLTPRNARVRTTGCAPHAPYPQGLRTSTWKSCAVEALNSSCGPSCSATSLPLRTPIASNQSLTPVLAMPRSELQLGLIVPVKLAEYMDSAQLLPMPYALPV